MILLIDGNFFAHRVRSALGLTFKHDIQADTTSLNYECTNILCGELRKLPDVTRVIIAKDYSSWRRDINVLRPKGYDDQTYKQNRDDVEKDYDSTEFYNAYTNWVNSLQEKLNIPIVSHYKAEADDIVHILSKGISKKGVKVLLWTSDGDYVQNVDENISLLKFPKRQLIMHESKNTPVSIFNLNENLDEQGLKSSFLEADLIYVNPNVSLFEKVVHGDKKDNVSPIMFWKSSTGNNMKPSTSYITKALNDVGVEFGKITEDFMYNGENVKEFLFHLLYRTKQMKGVDFSTKKKMETSFALICENRTSEVQEQIDEIFEIYKCNLKLKHLSLKQIPKEISDGVIEAFKKVASLKHDVKNISNFEATLSVLGLGAKKESAGYFGKFNLVENMVLDMNK